MNFRLFLLASTGFCALASASYAKDPAASNAYVKTIFVANKQSYNPTLGRDAKFINAWGIANRPAGAGGHFWVTAKNVSYEYVGDVQNSPDEKLRKLHTDKLERVELPVGGDENFATGVVFNDSKDNFVITQKVPDVKEPITAPAKFMFASDGGIISAWTERKKEDGAFDRPPEAIAVIDGTKDGSQFFGLAISANYDRLYAADFGAVPSIKVYDGKFQPVNVVFDAPFDTNTNDKVDPGEYAPFNVHGLKTPAGENHIFVTYALTQPCPAEEMEKGTCAKDALFVGEEDTANPGSGRLAEFTEDGKLVKVWNDGGKLSAPWGLTFAPDAFGALSNTLLVANFGDGTIAAFDPATQTFKDVMRDASGTPIKVDKVWGLLFGNGENLGDKNALYYAAGPKDEADGEFGSIRITGIK